MSAPFKRILIANRGEVAVRIARTCKQLGIETVAVCSDAETDALHVEVADQSVVIGKSRVQDSYLNLQAIIHAVTQTGADAVHPGYGLLSEDPRFAEAVSRTGATFIGPNPAALAALGDKLQARALAAQAGIRMAPGTNRPLQLGEPESVFAAAREVGYPLLVKASAGGGGIGMMPVGRDEDLLQVAQTCSKRAQVTFGDGRVYIEKFLQKPRHVEVQVAADIEGNVVTLGERECSVQRRHQKVLEEGPSPADFVDGAFRERLLSAARVLIDKVQFGGQRYVGLATVEFLLDASHPGEFYFLEVNARLQVEHPVTEMLTGLDLVALQLELAAGRPIERSALESSGSGHAIEARIYAEDPARRFLPQPGTLQVLRWPSASQDLRVDAGYRQGNQVTPYYDPLLAKVIASGSTRVQAISRLVEALGETQLKLVGPKGPRVSNLPFLVRVLGSAGFASGQYTTHLIEELMA